MKKNNFWIGILIGGFCGFMQPLIQYEKGLRKGYLYGIEYTIRNLSIKCVEKLFKVQ